MALTHSPSLPGGSAYLIESQSIGYDAVAEDQEDEAESFHANKDIDHRPEAGSHRFPDPSSTQHKLDQEQLSRQLKKASENVVVTGTLAEYARCAWAWNMHASLLISP